MPAAPHRGLTWDDVKALVIDSMSSPHSKRACARALDFAGSAKQAGRGLPSPKRWSSATACSSRRKDSRHYRANIYLYGLRMHSPDLCVLKTLTPRAYRIPEAMLRTGTTSIR